MPHSNDTAPFPSDDSSRSGSDLNAFGLQNSYQGDNLTLGVLGSGQLGKMLGLAAAPLSISTGFLAQKTQNPSAGIIGRIFPVDDPAEQENFVKQSSVITYESENVDAGFVEALSQNACVRPSVAALVNSQHRWREKDMFHTLGIKTAPYEKVSTLQDLQQAVVRLGLPIILKTATEGYDGKGQVKVDELDQIEEAWKALTAASEDDLELKNQSEFKNKTGFENRSELIAEAFISFNRECSLIAVRNPQNERRYYPMTLNEHQAGILRISRLLPGEISEDLEHQARVWMDALFNHLDYVGVLALELFETDDGLLANEMAPRVHNSGHWTQLGSFTSQFDNHLRALFGLPLGVTDACAPFAAMVNFIGTTPSNRSVLAVKNTQLHLYGKEPRPGRKLGHLNLVADSEDELEERIQQVLALMN